MGRVQTARHDGLLRRLFSIKGGGSLLPETLGDLFPTLDVEDLPAELLALAGFQLGIAGRLATSPVAQTAGHQLINPAGSGMLVMPTLMMISADKASTYFLDTSTVALASANVGLPRDTRRGVTQLTSAQVRSGNNPAASGSAFRIALAADENFILSDQNGLAVLAPGTALTIVSVTTNITIHSGWLWRERIAEPSELSL